MAPGGTVAPWASVDADASTIEPGEEAAFEVTVEVPETAAPGASFLDLVAQVDGESEESAHAPLTVVVLGEAPASAQNEQAQEDSGSLGVPAPSALAATVAALAAAGARRRWKA